MVARIEVKRSGVIAESGFGNRHILGVGKGMYKLRDPVPGEELLGERPPGDSCVILTHPDGKSKTKIQTSAAENIVTTTLRVKGGKLDNEMDLLWKLTHTLTFREVGDTIKDCKGKVLAKVNHIDQ